MSIEITNIEKISFISIETDSVCYRRFANNIWEQLMGCSWESISDTTELEKSYQKYLHINHPEVFYPSKKDKYKTEMKPFKGESRESFMGGGL